LEAPPRADTDEHDREELDAADESMDEQAVIHRQQGDKAVERRPSEIQHEPQDEESKRAPSERRTRDRRHDDPEEDHRGDDRQAVMVHEIAGEEPTEER